MSFLTPRLPLSRNLITGYALIDDYVSLVKQNFKNLLLTLPGERVMNPDFGIGLKRFLFETDNPLLYDDVAESIREQVKKYLPYIQINDIIFNSATIDSSIQDNTLYVRLEYRIVPLELNDAIDITGVIN